MARLLPLGLPHPLAWPAPPCNPWEPHPLGLLVNVVELNTTHTHPAHRLETDGAQIQNTYIELPEGNASIEKKVHTDTHERKGEPNTGNRQPRLPAAADFTTDY